MKKEQEKQLIILIKNIIKIIKIISTFCKISLIMLPNKTLQLVTEYDTVQILNNNEI